MSCHWFFGSKVLFTLEGNLGSHIFYSDEIIVDLFSELVGFMIILEHVIYVVAVVKFMVFSV